MHKVWTKTVHRVTVHDTVGFLKVSVPFPSPAEAEEYARLMRNRYPDGWPVEVTERDERTTCSQVARNRGNCC